MAIRPIGVSFEGNKAIRHEGNKKETSSNKNSGYYISTPLKAVPLAVLLAMSPLNTTANSNYSQSSLEQVIPQEKVVGINKYERATYEGDNCEIQFISTDGNDSDAEKIKLTFKHVSEFKNFKEINGEMVKVPFKKTVYNIVTIDTLKTVNVIEKLPDGKVRKYPKFFVSGSGIHERIDEEVNSTSKKPYKNIMRKEPNMQIEIRPEFFNLLKDFMGDEVNYKTETETYISAF